MITKTVFQVDRICRSKWIGWSAVYLMTLLSCANARSGSSVCSTIANELPMYLSESGKGFDPTPDIPFIVTARIPHDREAFTQGFVFYNGTLYESTGRYGESSVRKIDPESGRVLDLRHLNAKVFAEGLSVLNNRLVQLTWHSQTAFVYTADLRLLDTLGYAGEAWGITTLEREGRMAVSDGSSTLMFFSSNNFRPVATLSVTDRNRAVAGLNELEYVGGMIFANVFPTDCIAQINPITGQIVSWIDLSGLLPLSGRVNGSAVANGIAYDSETGTIFVTGKFWPYIFGLKFDGKMALTRQSVRIYDAPVDCGQVAVPEKL